MVVLKIALKIMKKFKISLLVKRNIVKFGLIRSKFNAGSNAVKCAKWPTGMSKVHKTNVQVMWKCNLTVERWHQSNSQSLEVSLICIQKAILLTPYLNVETWSKTVLLLIYQCYKMLACTEMDRLLKTDRQQFWVKLQFIQ